MMISFLQKVPFKKANQFLMRFFGERVRTVLYLILLAFLLCDNALWWMRSSSTALHVEIPWVWPIVITLLMVYIYVLSDYNIGQLCLITLGIASAGMSLYCSECVDVFCLFLYVFAARCIPYKKICGIIFSVNILCVLFVILGCYLGWANDYVLIRSESLGNGALRHSLGFGTANTIGVFVFAIFLAGYSLFQRRGKIWYYTALALVTIVLFILTNSKNFLLCMLSIVLAMGIKPLVQKISLRKQILFFSIITTLCIILVFHAISCFDTNNPFHCLLDELYSGRFHLGCRALWRAGLSPFGSSIAFDYPVDSLFAWLPIRYGVFTTLAFFIATYASDIRCLRQGHLELVLLSLVTLLFGISEPVMLLASFNVLLFTLTAPLDESNTAVSK